MDTSVITSYSIHYTKLYDNDISTTVEQLGSHRMTKLMTGNQDAALF